MPTQTHTHTLTFGYSEGKYDKKNKDNRKKTLFGNGKGSERYTRQYNTATYTHIHPFTNEMKMWHLGEARRTVAAA